MEQGPLRRDEAKVLTEARSVALKVERAVAAKGPGPVIEHIAKNVLDELALQVNISGVDLGVDVEAISDALNSGEIAPQEALETGIDSYGPQRFIFQGNRSVLPIQACTGDGAKPGRSSALSFGDDRCSIASVSWNLRTRKMSVRHWARQTCSDRCGNPRLKIAERMIW